jgi:hypothetical protein
LKHWLKVLEEKRMKNKLPKNIEGSDNAPKWTAIAGVAWRMSAF